MAFIVPEVIVIVAVPSFTILPSKPPDAFFVTVTIVLSDVVAVAPEITAVVSDASTGSVVILNTLVSPTLPVHVFWLGTIPVAGVKLLGGFSRMLRL